MTGLFANISIEEVFQDNSGGECLGGQNDCSIVYTLENVTNDITLIDGETIYIGEMPTLRYLNATMTCDAYSCPQSRSVAIIIQEVGV